MKVVILAGGLGTRLSEETTLRPKPMVEIGGKPILWHIMKIYSYYGYNEFIICLGYMGYFIKEYFAHYFLHQSDVTFNFGSENEMDIINCKVEPWRVTLIDTGQDTMTGGRIKRIKEYISGERFMMTYGDGVGNVDITELVKFHEKSGSSATLTSSPPPGRFGALELGENNIVKSFQEKPRGDGSWINAGYFVFEPEIFNYLEGDETVLENEPLATLASESKLSAYKHSGFWMPMDTLRDKNKLEELYTEGNAPWKLWTD